MTRGEALHNPFDLELDGIEWNGLISTGTDTTFCEFIDDLHGLRAGFVNLKSQLREGFDTLETLITKFAPPSENNTIAYITAVSARTNIGKDAVLTLSELKNVGIAIIHQEQGECIYSDALINNALSLAGIPLPQNSVAAS